MDADGDALFAPPEIVGQDNIFHKFLDMPAKTR
jgi:hypothetical protein